MQRVYNTFFNYITGLYHQVKDIDAARQPTLHAFWPCIKPIEENVESDGELMVTVTAV
jgi:hypothetical protein